MQRMLVLLACVMVAAICVACLQSGGFMQEALVPSPDQEGKIAIITWGNYPRNSDWHTVQPVIDKYGEDKVLHVTWPDRMFENRDKAIKLIEELGADMEIKAFIVNWPIPEVFAAFENLREVREDIFVVYCCSSGSDLYAMQTADLILSTDMLGMNTAMVEQAYKLGAKTLVYYSSPRAISGYQALAHDPDFYADDPGMRETIRLEQALLKKGQELIRAKCADLGMELVEVTATDPAGNHHDFDEYAFLAAGIPEMVEKYGKDIAFYGTRGLSPAAIIKEVVEAGAIFPQTWRPHPYEGFDRALLGLYISDDGYEADPVTYENPGYVMASLEDIFARIRAVLAGKNMLGRLSTWPVKDEFMYTFAAAGYAAKWINGEVAKDGVDVKVLKQIMEDYAGVEVHLTPYKDEYPYTSEGTGGTYENSLLIRMEYITF